MGFHGGVYGIVPREVWDMTCIPELAVSDIDRMRVVWMHDGNCFEPVCDLMRKDNWEFRSEVRWGMGEFYKTCTLAIAIDERNIHAMLDLQSSGTDLMVNYEFREKDPDKENELCGVLSGEGFLEDYSDGEVTITTRESSPLLRLAYAPLERFTKLELWHPYRRVCYHHDDASDTEGSEDIGGHYELSESESDEDAGDTGGSPYTTL
jgi:hypothetical protein